MSSDRACRLRSGATWMPRLEAAQSLGGAESCFVNLCDFVEIQATPSRRSSGALTWLDTRWMSILRPMYEGAWRDRRRYPS